MVASTKEKGGGFHELRAHLALFSNRAHRHDRGWPHSLDEEAEAAARKPRWKTVGIVHFPSEDEQEEKVAG